MLKTPGYYVPMKIPRPQFIAALATVFLIVLFVFNIWLLLDSRLPPSGLALVMLTELLVLVSLVWVLCTLIHVRLFRPLHMLEDQFKLLTHADAHHRFTLPDQHYLGSLPDTARAFGQELTRERHQTARAIDSATARIDQRRTRLEAILHDLTEGVIVCSPDHQIVLFNQSASMLLKDVTILSLHRNIQSFFKSSLIDQKFHHLMGLYESESKREIIEFDDSLRGVSRGVRLRMNLIVEPDGSCSGYVLTLPGHDRLNDQHGRYDQSIMTDRPEFYDFSLFDRDTSLAQSDRPLSDLTFVVFDTETTGLRPSKGDEIVQISGVRIVDNTILESDEFDRLVNPGFPIPQSSIRFHGITDDMVENADGIVEVLKQFHAFAEGSVLVAHNAAFDMKFLKLKEEKTGVSFDHPVLDTLLLSFVLQPNHSAHTLDAIAARFGIEIPTGARHTALGDARSTAEIFLRMLDALPHHDIKTLGEAIQASNQVFEIRKLQESF
ncbi:MAG: exonuclease domain-containing protein [Arenicellales bacterium]|nr:exonuclease domain-containing protein [Arenicellales bacterium]